MGFLISWLKKRWNFKNPETKCMQVGKKRMNKCQSLWIWEKRLAATYIWVLVLNLNHEIDPAAQNRGRSLCLFGIQVSSARFFVDSSSYSKKERNGRKLQEKGSIERAIFEPDSRQDYECCLTNLTNYNVLKMEIEI